VVTELLGSVRRYFGRLFDRIHVILEHPLWHAFIGTYFLGAAIYSIAHEMGHDAEQWALRSHYAMSLLGIMIIIRSVSEFLENLEESTEEFESLQWMRSKEFVGRLYKITHSKQGLLITGSFLFLAGFTDAIEFALVDGGHGISSHIMTVLLSFSFFGYVVLGATEGLHQLSPSAQRARIEDVLTPHLQLFGALLVLCASLWEGVTSAGLAWESSHQRATFLWALSESIRNGIRSIEQIKQAFSLRQ
jgi:hypothetical protein